MHEASQDRAEPEVPTCSATSPTERVDPLVSAVAELATHPLDIGRIATHRGERKLALKDLLWSLGARYSECSLDSYQVTNDRQRFAVDSLHELCGDVPSYIRAGGGVILYGKPGTGKDHLLAACLKVAVYKFGLTVIWRDGEELWQEIRDAIGNNRERETVKQFQRCHILAVSDPQPDRAELTDHQTRMFNSIVDGRYRRQLSTWITSNCPNPRAMAEALTTRVYDRLRENALQLNCDWESYRA